MTRLELIAALNAAPGPSRELDAHIRAAVFGSGAEVRQSPRNGAWCLYRPGTDMLVDEVPDRATNYTGSLDAAVTLIPHGWVIASTGLGTKWVVRLRCPVNPGLGWPHHGAHDVWAIAICIAALRATDDNLKEHPP